MSYNKDDFMEMIKDWKADNSPNYDDLEIIEVEYLEETQEWAAVAQDKKNSYSLTDDGLGNIVINYSGIR